MSILDETANEAPDGGGEMVKFVSPGDAIVVQFKSRKNGVKTKLGDDASVTQGLAINSTISSISPGMNVSIFEPTHVRQILDEAGLQKGDGFILRFAETKGRFKKFYFKKLTETELAEEAETKGVTLEAVPF
jgi:hypothetical protein